MKNFLQSIPNKAKAIYVLWFFLNLILFIIGSKKEYWHLFRNGKDSFFPFDKVYNDEYSWVWVLNFNISVYDLTELIIYTLAPISLYLIFYLWTKKD